jgi:hypothetical protein
MLKNLIEEIGHATENYKKIDFVLILKLIYLNR